MPETSQDDRSVRAIIARCQLNGTAESWGHHRNMQCPGCGVGVEAGTVVLAREAGAPLSLDRSYCYLECACGYAGLHWYVQSSAYPTLDYCPVYDLTVRAINRGLVNVCGRCLELA